jgi:hypothetical protein
LRNGSTAERHGVEMGERIDTAGRPFRVVGLSDG